MGIMPDPISSYCNRCQQCFPVGQTPSQLKVFFGGIRAAELSESGTSYPGGGYYDVPVVHDQICYWDTGDGNGGPRVKVRLSQPYAMVELWDASGVVFQSWDLPPCTSWFENQRIWAGHYWWKGFAFVANPGLVSGTGPSASKLDVSGVINPDATGKYNIAGTHNDKSYYKYGEASWYIWWDGDQRWTISEKLGLTGEAFWTLRDWYMFGGYSPQGSATGVAGVSKTSCLFSLANIITRVTPLIDPDPRMECFPMDDKHVAVRYAGKRDATNIMIKFDTDV